MPTTTLSAYATLTVMTCSHQGCGVTFALDDEYVANRRKDHATWYCPNGHARYYPQKNSEETAREQLRETERELEASRTIARRERERREHAERQRSAARGQVTRIKNRVGRGVCPCCNRTFADLARHMQGQHPEFIEPTHG